MQAPSTQLDGGILVGGAGPGAKALMVVVASDAEEGEGQREVTAYLCDGAEISEWFEGEAAGKLDITSEGGARLKGKLAPESATGTITQEDNTSITFIAPPAYGAAGLYNVDISRDGSLRRLMCNCSNQESSEVA